MIGRKVWRVTCGKHEFALFRRIGSTQASTRPAREIQARISWESPKVHIHQPTFVIHGKSISSDHITGHGRRVRGRRSGSLRTNKHPIGRGKAWNWITV